MDKMRLVLFLLVMFPVTVFAQTGYELLSDSINNVDSVKSGQKITIPGFYFDAGSSSVNSNLENYLAKIADKIKKAEYRKIYVDGYTDNSGDNAANNRLSRARAQSVMKELVANGISKKKIQARAYGASSPIASNNTVAGRVQNRRIEITVN